MRRRTKLNILFMLGVFLIIYRRFDTKADERLSTLTFIPRLIYNRTVRAIETFRHRDDINLVELVTRHGEIEARFERRRTFLKHACQDMGLNRTLGEGEINTLAGNVLADANFPAYNNRQKTGFFGCMPPESGFTVFSSWLFDAYYPQDEFNQAGRAKLAQKVGEIDLDALLANEKTVTFAVVRHPMTRFVSSWDDHFCPDCAVGSDIMSQNPVLSELASRWQFDGDEYQIRFDLLAKYLVENGDGFDDYFKSQATSCAMCSIDFQYIIKLETLHEDISYLIAKLGRLDNTKELVSPETVAKNKNVNLYRYYFNTLNEELLNKLVAYYNLDSSLFNYTFDLAKRAIGGWD